MTLDARPEPAGPEPPDDGIPLSIAGDTRLVVIVGDPIAQVGSPALFNAEFYRRGIRAALVPAHVAAADLSAFVAGLRVMQNLDGIVITIPHKIAFVDLVDKVGANGRRVGAVNAVRREADGTLVADNFDGEGCCRALEGSAQSVADRSVLLLGAGGAGRSIAHSLADRGVARLGIHDVDPQRVEQLVASVRAHHGVDVEAVAADPEGFDVIVNATPLGMRPGDATPVDPSRIASGTVVIDVILKPDLSPFLLAAKERGAFVQTGRQMLAGQVEAIIGFVGGGDRWRSSANVRSLNML